MAYEFVHGPIPDGLVIHHRCEQKDCVRVDHLGAKSHRGHALGHRGTGRITLRQAAEIRALKGIVPQVELAERYGVSRRYIRLIFDGSRLR